MIIRKILGHIHSVDETNKKVDWLEVEWEELNKRILKKTTLDGVEIGISLEKGNTLSPGDILYSDDDKIIVVRTVLEEVFIITPHDMQEMGKVAFELGNRHTQCIIRDGKIYLRYDHTLEALLNEVGAKYERAQHRFQEPFKYRGHQH